jgi:hypothetical protein
MEVAVRRVWQPAVVLVLLSPVVGELLSGSSPPAEFFSPLTFVLLTAFYGSGALLVRELTVRWKKGWPSILLLGMAYGIVEEGLAVKSFFDPAWMDLGVLGVYGRWAGVNWVWSVGLTLYHAVFSIAIPIALTYLLFPQRAHEPWIRRRALRIWAGVLASVVVLCNLLLTTYRPPAGHFLLAGAVVFLLGLLARRAPLRLGAGPASELRRPRTILLGSFTATIGLFTGLWVLPNTGLPPWITLGLIIGWAALVYWTGCRQSGLERPEPRRGLAAVSGALLFFILLAPISQLDPQALDDRSGMALVGLATGIFLVGLARHVNGLRPSIAAAPGD